MPAPQDTAEPQSVQPVAWAAHVCTPLPEHWVAPAAH